MYLKQGQGSKVTEKTDVVELPESHYCQNGPVSLLLVVFESNDGGFLTFNFTI